MAVSNDSCSLANLVVRLSHFGHIVQGQEACIDCVTCMFKTRVRLSPGPIPFKYKPMKSRYKSIKVGGKKYDLHRFIAEYVLWRCGIVMGPNIVVHHINGNKLDNRIENLALVSRKTHARDHQLGAEYGEVTRKKDSDSAKKQWEAHRKRMLEASHSVKAIAYNPDGTMHKSFDSCLQAEREEGHDNRILSNIKQGRRSNVYNGYTWKFQ